MAQITPKLLRDICRKHKLYTTPELNEVLYLHYNGFTDLQHLEPYTGLKTLWIEGNGLRSLEGLSAQTDLRCLYAQENCIETINHLSHMTLLDQLNLNQNYITCIENLESLVNLRSLHLKRNGLKTPQSISKLIDCPSLSVLDLSDNQLDDPFIIDILSKLSNLKVLYLNGNPVVKNIPNYRKTLITKLPNLTYLDDRPVFDSERLLVEAWVKGGREGEQEERRRQVKEKNDKEVENLRAFREKFVGDKTFVWNEEEIEDHNDDIMGQNDDVDDEELPGLEDEDGFFITSDARIDQDILNELD
ncbi:hypothetical protein P9112_001105 [Eukaryota sp. TZLM1-RC]